MDQNVFAEGASIGASPRSINELQVPGAEDASNSDPITNVERQVSHVSHPQGGERVIVTEVYTPEEWEEKNRAEGGGPTSDTPNLDKFGVDVTALAREGRLDPLVNRKDQLERAFQILQRRTKNNPVFVGEAGVGKSALVDGLAQAIVSGNCPESLKGHRIISLNLTSLMAGAGIMGEYENRASQVFDEVKKAGNIILFIDEMHNMIGAGASRAMGTGDLANILKPELARGDMRVIGATTHEEYDKHIKRDAALNRRFQSIPVPPTTPEETMAILERLAPIYAEHHGIEIPAAPLLREIERISARYMPDRVQPDKAIDLMDEIGARARRRAASPANTEVSEEAQREHAIQELDALRTQKTELLASMGSGLAALSQSLVPVAVNSTQPLSEVVAAQHVDAKSALGQFVVDYLEAERRQASLNAYLRGEKDLEFDAVPLTKTPGTNSLESEAPAKIEITIDDVLETAEGITGVPLKKRDREEFRNLLALGNRIKERVVGQEQAVDQVVDVVIRNRAGLGDPNRPIGSFMFLGPTGVGKTRLAEVLADELGMTVHRFDMSEYQERHTGSKLIGAPPGYVGYDEGGELTRVVSRSPYSVVLLNEIEKAHPDIYNTLLQALDKGELRDARNPLKPVSFRNTIVIMTSNIGQTRQSGAGDTVVGFAGEQKDGRSLREVEPGKAVLKRSGKFPPEFINRLDGATIFNELDNSEMRKIVDIEVGVIVERFEKLGHTLEVSPEAREVLLDSGFVQGLGGRNLKKALENLIETPLARRSIQVHAESEADSAGEVQKLAFSVKVGPEGDLEYSVNPR